MNTEGSGRLDLANQIASPNNPLTARVIVNRVWHHHFGAGIVRSLSNFGAAGDRPSHPELLDYLARSFMENGWSIKKLHREILLSSAYAMSTRPSEKAICRRSGEPAAVALQSPAPGCRDAARRDARCLGQISSSTWAVRRRNGTRIFERRTVYGEVSRFRPERYLTLFDFPDPSFHAEKRMPTNTSVQRLFFLNSDFIKQQSADLAARVKAMAPDDSAGVRCARCYSLLFGRAPEAAGIERCA